MRRLTIVNLRASGQTFQDFLGVSGFAAALPGLQTRWWDVPDAVVDALTPQLEAARGLGHVEWSSSDMDPSSDRFDPVNGDEVALAVGMAVALVDGEAVRARADSAELSTIIGIVVVGAAPGDRAVVQVAGIAAMPGGALVPGRLYYVSATPGVLTDVEPSSGYLACAGRAVSALGLLIDIEPSILL